MQIKRKGATKNMEQLTKEGKTPQELAAYNLTILIISELQKGGFDAFRTGGYYDISAKVGLIIYRTILNAEQGAAKKFVCDVAEEHLKQDAADEMQEHAELIRRLDEIRELLKTGVSIIPTETNDTQENVKQSPKVSGLLSALGL